MTYNYLLSVSTFTLLARDNFLIMPILNAIADVSFEILITTCHAPAQMGSSIEEKQSSWDNIGISSSLLSFEIPSTELHVGNSAISELRQRGPRLKRRYSAEKCGVQMPCSANFLGGSWGGRPRTSYQLAKLGARASVSKLKIMFYFSFRDTRASYCHFH